MMTPAKTTARPKTTPRLDRLRRLIDRALEDALPSIGQSPRILPEAMRYCVCSSGKGRRTNVQHPKRFRPLLCLAACETVGGRAQQALAVACAIELIHTYSLVHDDLPAMDNATQRRGKPSCHRRFGEATAILVGDALLTRAFELLSANGTPNTLAILRVLGQASGTGGLIGGQVLDVDGARHQSKRDVKRLEEIARRKTAALITASVVAGGLAAGVSGTVLARLGRFGERLGLAFQLKDDLHDQDGLVRAIGAGAVEARAQRLIHQANGQLAPFGTRADLLLALTDWLARS